MTTSIGTPEQTNKRLCLDLHSNQLNYIVSEKYDEDTERIQKIARSSLSVQELDFGLVESSKIFDLTSGEKETLFTQALIRPNREGLLLPYKKVTFLHKTGTNQPYSRRFDRELNEVNRFIEFDFAETYRRENPEKLVKTQRGIEKINGLYRYFPYPSGGYHSPVDNLPNKFNSKQGKPKPEERHSNRSYKNGEIIVE